MTFQRLHLVEQAGVQVVQVSVFSVAADGAQTSWPGRWSGAAFFDQLLYVFTTLVHGGNQVAIDAATFALWGKLLTLIDHGAGGELYLQLTSPHLQGLSINMTTFYGSPGVPAQHSTEPRSKATWSVVAACAVVGCSMFSIGLYLPKVASASQLHVNNVAGTRPINRQVRFLPFVLSNLSVAGAI